MRPALPAGRAGGVILGILLMVFAGSRLDPLRADNPDFGLVGPAWLSVLAFTTVALFQGMLIVALAARTRSFLGVPPRRWPPRLVIAGRVAVGVAVLAAIPGFVAAVLDILRAG